MFKFQNFLTNDQSIEIINQLINDDVHNLINQDLLNYFIHQVNYMNY